MASSNLLIAPEKPHTVLFGKSETEKRGSESAQLIDPPRARVDPWYWLRDDERKDKAVLGWLQKEADHAKASTAHLDGFRKVLYDEHISHLKQTDSQTPYPYGEFYYYTRTIEGKSYKLHCRRTVAGDDASAAPLSAAKVEASESAEEVLLDINVLGEGKSHCDVRGVKPSPSHARLAYSVDYSGDETYGVFVRDISTGEVVDDAVKACAGSVSRRRREREGAGRADRPVPLERYCRAPRAQGPGSPRVREPETHANMLTRLHFALSFIPIIPIIPIIPAILFAPNVCYAMLYTHDR